MKLNALAGLLSLLIFCNISNAQVTISTKEVADKVKNSLTTFTEKYPQEKVYLQTDRNYYAAGETIWMKAWVTLDGVPTFLSRVLYVTLLNQAGVVIDKKMYKLDSLASTPCDLLIDKTLPTGNYHLQAYTLWMKNFPAFVANSNIYIYGSDFKKKTGNKNTAVSANMVFFPEGGDMVAGIESKVAFKVSNNNDQPLVAQGKIVDEKENEVVNFATRHEGMGVFKMMPKAGTPYYAIFTDITGKKQRFKLPEAKNEGIVMAVNNASPSRVFVTVKKSESLGTNFNKLLITGQMNNKLVYAGEVDFAEGATGAAITKKGLPAGILQITLFDDKGNPVAERVVFINNATNVEATINPANISFNAKDKNKLEISLPIVSKPNVSVCITDATTDANSDPANILSTLLLTSDLKGNIINPNFYFRNTDTTTMQKLDLLMLTQGWRRFVWKDLIAGNYPPLKYIVEPGLAIRGKVTKPGSNTPVTDGRVDFIIQAKDSTTILAKAALSKDGEFNVSDINFKKEAAVSYQGTNAKKERFVVDVKLDDTYIDTLKRSSLLNHLDIDTIKNTTFEKNYVEKQLSAVDSILKARNYLGNVTVTTRKLSVVDSLNKAYSSGLFEFGGKSIDASRVNYFSVWQLISAQPGFTVQGDFKDPQVFVKRNAGLNVFSENGTSVNDDVAATTFNYVENGIAFYLNEIPVSKDVLDNLSISDVVFVKTYVGAEAGSVGPYDGVIAVYTKKGIAIGSSVLDKALAKRNMSGYAYVREFYTPDYSKMDPTIAPADTRITLFWKPTIKWDASNKTSIQFFNNDQAKKYKILVQGLTGNGQIIFAEKILGN